MTTSSIVGVEARTSPKIYMIREDPMKSIVIQPLDIFRFTAEPSQQPTDIPSQTQTPSFSPSSWPSRVPSQKPSKHPSFVPSMQPSMSFSSQPTQSPTTNPSYSITDSPSDTPTNVHTAPFHNSYYPIDHEDPHLNYYIPDNNASYFNYNPYDPYFGPGLPSTEKFIYNETTVIVRNDNNSTVLLNETKVMNYTKYQGNRWEFVRGSDESKYWEQFDMQRTLENRCSSDPWRKQSPIDLCPNIVNAECFEHHQIRIRVSAIS